MFPGDWPEGCPPTDAVAASGAVYRLVRADPPVSEDFHSLWEQGRPVREKLCESAGLSIFRILDDAVHCAKKYPYLGGGIAVSQLESRHGRVKPTPRRGNSHATWWPAAGIDRHVSFIVVSS